MASTSTASRHFGHIIKEHTVEVPLSLIHI